MLTPFPKHRARAFLPCISGAVHCDYFVLIVILYGRPKNGNGDDDNESSPEIGLRAIILAG